MVNIIADTHTHTMANDHAYSTLNENAIEANRIGLKFLCCTEHGSALAGAPTELHFHNQQILPRYLHDVMIVRGAEVNIMDYDGKLDLNEKLLKELEWRIASFHSPCLKPQGKKETTKAWRAIAENPYIDVIGHCGNMHYDFEHEEVIKSFADNNKVVEINNHSFLVRPGSKENCPKIAKLCAEYGVNIVVSSDAHFYSHIGNFNNALTMLEEIGFPQELILNADEKRFLEKLHSINGGTLDGE